MKYGVSFFCPVCYERVGFVADNLYDADNLCYDSPRNKMYLMPTHLVLHPCKHRVKELNVNRWGGIRCRLLYPGKIENPRTVEDEGFNAFVECKEKADNPYFPYKVGWGRTGECNEWFKGWHRAQELAKQLC